jgi:two-component system phosphate regulon sensor histidine kinase PhoR
MLVILAVVLTAAIIGSSLTMINLSALKNTSRELYLAVAQNVGDEISHRVAVARSAVLHAANVLGSPDISAEASLELVKQQLSHTNETELIAVYDTLGVLIDAIVRGSSIASTRGGSTVATGLAVQIPQVLPPAVMSEVRGMADGNAPAKQSVFVGSLQPLAPGAAPVIPVIAAWRTRRNKSTPEQINGWILAVVSNSVLNAIVAEASARAFGGNTEQVYILDEALRLAASASVVPSLFQSADSDSTSRSASTSTKIGSGVYTANESIDRERVQLIQRIHQSAAQVILSGTLSSSSSSAEYFGNTRQLQIRLPAMSVGGVVEYVRAGTLSSMVLSINRRQQYESEQQSDERAQETGFVGTFLVLPRYKCAVVVEQLQAVAYRSFYAMRQRVVMWGIIGAGLGVMLSVLVARQFTKPIATLVDVSERFAVQDFSPRLPEYRSDEIGKLFRVYNRVGEKLAEYQQLNVQHIISERNKLEAIVRQASDGVLVVDANGVVLVANTVFCSWFDTVPADVEHRSLSEVLKNESLCDTLGTTLLEALQHKESDVLSLPVELSLMRPEEVRERIVRGSLLRVVVNKELAAIAVVLRDVTKEVTVDRMKTELVSVVAHELRSPLTSMIGMSELIADGECSPEEAAEYAGRVVVQARRLNGIITKFLDLNRIESGKTEFKAVPFKLEDVLQSVLRVNTRLAEQKSIKIVMQAPRKIPPVVGDPDMIGQVIVNLFSNAIKYSAPSTSVTIAITEHEDVVRFSIRDEGFGISESSQQNLFTKFFRATDDARVAAEAGTGLGLAFVKEVVERHGGAVGVSSRIYEGSTFWFTLPKHLS